MIERRLGPLPDPDRDYMTDPDVKTIGDALKKMDAEARETYRRAGEPLGFLYPWELLEWWGS